MKSSSEDSDGWENAIGWCHVNYKHRCDKVRPTNYNYNYSWPSSTLHSRRERKRNKGRLRMRWIENTNENIKRLGLTFRRALDMTNDRQRTSAVPFTRTVVDRLPGVLRRWSSGIRCPDLWVFGLLSFGSKLKTQLSTPVPTLSNRRPFDQMASCGQFGIGQEGTNEELDY